MLESGPDNNQGLNEQDIAYTGGMLVISATNAPAFDGGTNVLQEYDASTLAFIQSVPVDVYGFASGLAGDGLGGGAKDDYYSVNVLAGQSLDLQTSTPSDQGGQFLNTASLEINLYDPLGNLVATGVKLADGRNEFLDFTAALTGQYTIEISEDPGGAGEYYLSVNTASYPAGGISGLVYNDLNGSGSYVAGDPGLKNWEVDVYDSSDNLVASEATDSNGDFSFGGLVPGTYTVEEEVMPGWTQTAPAPPGTFSVTVTAGGVVSGLQFGNFQDITVSGDVFNDLNGNGTQDPGDPGLPDWTIDLYDSAGDLIATTTTDVNGDYSFADLGPGTYTVAEVLPAGWVQTLPPPPGTYTVSATSGTDQPGLDFGNFELVTYSGTVYNDLTGSGVYNPSDPGLADWTVELLDSSGNIIATTTSAWDGSYSFADLAYGVYTIEEIMQAGWYQTEPQHPLFYTVTATSGASTSGLDFGNFQLVNVSGYVYDDANGDGKYDSGDSYLAGWTVDLLDQSGNMVASTTTASDGSYSFSSLFPATFSVVAVPETNWVQTQPLYPTDYSFTTMSGTNETNLIFGEHYATAASPLDVIDNGQPGYAETGSWSTVLGGFNGTNRVAATHRGSTTATASWTFQGLTTGAYHVYVTYAGMSDYSTAASFGIYNGSTLLSKQLINESILVTQSQGGRMQRSYGGVGWLELGSFNVTAGSLEVLLSNAANMSYVDADGMFIVPAADDSLPAVVTTSPPAGITSLSIGTVDVGQTTGVQNLSTTGNSSGKTSTPAVVLAGVTQPVAVNVVYSGTPPAQGNSPSVSIVDLAIGSLTSEDVITGKAKV